VIMLPIHETFQETIQGEGYWVGTPADFIRLAGCPVGCPWCDTGYATGGKGLPRSLRSVQELVGELRSPRVVITGGEPFLYPELSDLVDAIEATGRQVSIETSGAFWQEMSAQAWVTLSPKEHVSPRYPVQPNHWSRANEIKIVVETGEELAVYGQHLTIKSHCPIFLQPEWNSRDRSLPLTLKLLQQFPNYRLSIQLHKFVGVP
jgi:7-carboxy-7-deazaguanine synthase